MPPWGMAPIAPLGRDRVIRLVEEGKLPIWFGSPHPTMAVVEQDGVLRVRQLVIDQAEAKAIGEREIAAGRPWMPEMYYDLGQPTGVIYAEARTKEELVAKIREIDWPANW